MKVREIKEGVIMKGENQLHLSQEAMREFVQEYWNDRIVLHDKDKIKVESVEYNVRTKKFVVCFIQKVK